MVFKCSVVRCITNYDWYDKGEVFALPENEEQKKQLDLEQKFTWLVLQIQCWPLSRAFGNE